MSEFIKYKFEKGQVWTKPQLTEIFGSRDNNNLQKKLTRYGLEFSCSGRAEKAVYTILDIKDPFKLFAITSLGCDGNTNFKKLRDFYYIFFNDVEFSAMPDEVKETRMRLLDKSISRQTITKYIEKLENKNLIADCDFIYYFAHEGEQHMAKREEYLQAWHQYWAEVTAGVSSSVAIYHMKRKYGGVARKHPIPVQNAFYVDDIKYMLDLIQHSIEQELEQQEAEYEELSQAINSNIKLLNITVNKMN